MSDIKIEKTDQKSVGTPNKNKLENNANTNTTNLVPNQYYTTSDLQHLQAAQQAQLLAAQTSSASVLDNSSTSISTAAAQQNNGILATSGLGSSGTNTSNSLTDAANCQTVNGKTQLPGVSGLTTDTTTALAMAQAAQVGLTNTATNSLYASSAGLTGSTMNYGALSSSNPYGLTASGLSSLTGVGTTAGMSSNGVGSTYDPTGMSSMGSMGTLNSAYAASSAAAYGAYGSAYGYDMSDGVRRKNATRESTNTLKAWLNEHKKNPYPTKGEKIMLAIITKMTLTQVSTWFANARRRLKKENKMTWVPKNRSADDASDKSDNEEDQNLDNCAESNIVCGSTNNNSSSNNNVNTSTLVNQSQGIYGGLGVKQEDYGNAFYGSQDSSNLNATSSSTANANIWGTNIKTEQSSLSQANLSEVPQNSGLFAATQQALGGVGAQTATANSLAANSAMANAYQTSMNYQYAYANALAQSQNATALNTMSSSNGLLATGNPYGAMGYTTTDGTDQSQNPQQSQQNSTLSGLNSVTNLNNLNSPSQATNIYASNTVATTGAYSNPYLNTAYNVNSQALALGDGSGQYQVQDQSGVVQQNGGTGHFSTNK